MATVTKRGVFTLQVFIYLPFPVSPAAENLIPSLEHAIVIFSPNCERSRTILANSEEGIFTTQEYVVSCLLNSILCVN